MAIKIDMDMPKSCMYCRFVDVYHDPVSLKHYYWCRARGQEVNCKNIRDKHCPLKELTFSDFEKVFKLWRKNEGKPLKECE